MHKPRSRRPEERNVAQRNRVDRTMQIARAELRGRGRRRRKGKEREKCHHLCDWCYHRRVTFRSSARMLEEDLHRLTREFFQDEPLLALTVCEPCAHVMTQ